MSNLSWEEEARWIWTCDWTLEDDNKLGGFALFRKSFNIESEKYEATIRVSADSRYRFYINGTSVSFGPCKGDRFTWYYETIDITKYLKVGKNVIAAQVLRYPYSLSEKGNASVWRSPFAGFFLHGSILDENGNEILKLNTDDSWKSLKDLSTALNQGIYTVFLGITEQVEGRKVPYGWNLPDYDDKDWPCARQYEIDTRNGGLSPWQLTQRPIPLMKETERCFIATQRVVNSITTEEQWNGLIRNDTVISIPPYEKLIVEIDAGELTTAFINIGLRHGNGSTIKLLCAECYESKPYDEPWMRNKGDRTDSENGCLYGDYDIYEVAGFGSKDQDTTEVYEPFWFRTFRYIRIEIETGSNPLEIYKLAYREVGYPLDVTGEFSCSDNSLSRFWDVSIRTLKRCMHESYEDCPYYEQLQYVMDTRSEILFTYMVSGDDRLAKKTFYDFHSSMLPQGLTQSRYPSVMPQVIPGFSLYYIFMIHDHMMYFGDIMVIRRYMPTIDAILEYFNRMLDDHGLVGAMSERYWSFIDWTDEWRPLRGVPNAAKYGPITVLSLMYSAALRKAAEIASYIGREGVASEYIERAEEVSFSVIKYCKSNIKPGLFTDGPGIEEFSQQTQIWAVLSKTVKDEEAERLMKVILIDKSMAQCSFVMGFYLFRALSEVGLYDCTYSLWGPWKLMVNQNMTTWMEDTVSQRSDCHAWGSVPLYEFGAEILGVKPGLPGFNEIRICPKTSNLEWAKGKVPTWKGIVKVEWKKTNGKFIIEVDGPDTVPVVLILPDKSIKTFKSAASIRCNCKI